MKSNLRVARADSPMALARKSACAGATFAAVLGFAVLGGAMPAGASSPADQGVTATTITVGVPYVNFAALKSLGVTINDGSFPDAYAAVVEEHQRQRRDRWAEAASSPWSR